jgi:hypothetical protein
MAKLFILTGIVLLLVGLIIFASERFGLGRLPGDIIIEREGFTLYLPLATSLVVSLGLTLVLWLLSR